MELETNGAPRVVGAEVVEKEMSEMTSGVIERARELAGAIKDDGTRAVAAAYGVDLARKVKAIKAAREQKYEPLKKACDAVREFFDTPLKHLRLATDTLSAGVTAYDVEQQRKARIEQEAREAEARRQQEEYERKKREHEAEVRRIQEEAARVERERIEKEKAELARRIKEEEDARIAHATEAKAQGNGHKVDAILSHATPVAVAQPSCSPAVPVGLPTLPPPPPPPPAPAAVAVVAKRPDPASVQIVRWKWSCDDIVALARAVAEGRAPKEYLEVNRAPITTDVNRLKNSFQCSGLKAWPESKTSFRDVEA